MIRPMIRVGNGCRVLVVWALGFAACDPSTMDGNESSRAVQRSGSHDRGPDDTLHTHIVAASTPTDEGLVYLRAVADVHARADALTGEARVEALRGGLSLPVPAGLAEAEILRIDLAARLGEELMQARSPQGAAAARELLGPMLAVERSLPLDRATARALVVLGDAAVETGDDALAAGSYARSIEVMSLLRQELSQELRQELEP